MVYHLGVWSDRIFVDILYSDAAYSGASRLHLDDWSSRSSSHNRQACVGSPESKVGIQVDKVGKC